MLTFSPELAYTFALGLGIFGIFIGLSAVVLMIYWFFQDTTDKQLEEINKDVQELLLRANQTGSKHAGQIRQV